MSCTPLQCSNALDLYSETAEFGTDATRPPRRTTAVDGGVVLLKSMMAVPAVEAASSDNEAPASAELTVMPAMVSSAELYCKVNLPEVTPVPLLRLIGMPAVVRGGQVDRIVAVRPAGEAGDADDDWGCGHHEGRDVVAAGGVAVVGAVEGSTELILEAVVALRRVTV